jgi:nitrogen-specific signal transduction histidine kinase
LFSYGLGLSVVVQLLDEIGGKLEVMSKPGVGSTFRAHFPVEPSKTSASGDPGTERDSVRRVVRIR